MSKEKTSGFISVIELAQYESPTVTENTKDEYVSYGENNDHYSYLLERAKKSTTNGSVITNISRLIYGRGIGAFDASRKPADWAMLKSIISPKTLRGVASNLKTLGAGYLSVSYNKNHTRILKVDYIQTKLIRVGKCNKDGIIDKFYFSNDWDDLRAHPEKMIPAYGTSKDEIELYCIKFDSLDMKYYTDVDYAPCLPYTILEEEIADFLINDCQNHFSGSKILNFNNGSGTPESREANDKAVRGRLSGSKGDKIIIAYNDNKESATTIEDISLDDASEHYAYLAKESQSKILNAHGVISPMIVGIVTESQGFSSSADEIEISTKVFYNQHIVPFQELILDALNDILGFNNASLTLYFKRLNLMDSIEEKQQEKEEENVRMSKDLDSIIAAYGEDESEEWELMDSREVDENTELDLNNQVKEWEQESEPKETKLSKLVNFISTGTARGNAKSAQDKEVKDFHFKVRYKYEGSTGERGFCKAMMSANKIFRKEDIIKMGSQIVNAGFGESGANTYSIWLYKGGARCSHKWLRRTYVSASKSIDVNSPLANKLAKGGNIRTNQASKFGYRVNNDKKVNIRPKDMPLKGFSPRNKNLPKDVK